MSHTRTFYHILERANLRQTRFRKPEIVEAYSKVVPRFLASMEKPLNDGIIQHSIDVGTRCYAITGDERLAVLGFFHDALDRSSLSEEFSAFLKLVSSGGLGRFSLPRDELALIVDLNELIGLESFRRFNNLKILDRVSGSITRSIQTYQEIFEGLHGEDLVRAICLAHIAKLDRETRKRVYLGLHLDDERTLRQYADKIWYVYLAAAYRTGLVFKPFREIERDLTTIVAIGLNQDAFERVRLIKGKWNPTLIRLKEELEALLNSSFIKHIRSRLVDNNPFEVNIKADGNLTIKAVTIQKDKVGDITEDNLRVHNHDTLRIRFHLKEGIAPLHTLALVCNYLQRNGYQRVPGVDSHFRNNEIGYTVMVKDGFFIELQAIPPELLENLERGEKYHECYIGRRLNSHFGIPEDENMVLPPKTLRGIEARGIVIAALHDGKKLARPKARATLIPVDVAIETNFGPATSFRKVVFEDYCVGDVIAETMGLLNIPMRVTVNGESVSLMHEVNAGDDVMIHVVPTSTGSSFSYRYAQELLSHMSSLTGQAQCFSTIFENEWRRKQAPDTQA